jgi:predicted transposase YdaD
MAFRYEVVRMWEQPVEAFLHGHLGLTPLAPLCQVPDDLPLRDSLLGVIRQLVQRVEHEAPPEQRKKLLTAAYLLTGLRIARTTARDIFLGVSTMHESDTYQAILDEGEVRGLHLVILRQGRKRFGEPDQTTRERILAISEPEPLRELSLRLLDVNGWEELLRSE